MIGCNDQRLVGPRRRRIPLRMAEPKSADALSTYGRQEGQAGGAGRRGRQEGQAGTAGRNGWQERLAGADVIL